MGAWIKGRYYEEADVKATKKCTRCGGTGEIKAYKHVLGGVCFGCDGTGDMQVVEINKEKAKKQEIKELIEMVETTRHTMATSKFQFPAVQEERQKRLDWAIDRLRQYGVEV